MSFTFTSIFMQIKSHFHLNGFSQRLVLKLRQKATRKWSIDFAAVLVEISYKALCNPATHCKDFFRSHIFLCVHEMRTSNSCYFWFHMARESNVGKVPVQIHQMDRVGFIKRSGFHSWYLTLLWESPNCGMGCNFILLPHSLSLSPCCHCCLQLHTWTSLENDHGP